jgi:lyso-ornithine lipid O-acyltransferase
MQSGFGSNSQSAAVPQAKRPLGRIRATASLAHAASLIPLWLRERGGSPAARGYEAAFFARLLKGFGIVPMRLGQCSPLPGTLFVTNHISWADIPLLASALDADFVAKADILRWPVLGELARRLNPVFVARDCKRSAHAQADAIRQRLRTGRSVILCAEGTTSVGETVLPFKSCLFEAADAATVIQPLAIRYCAIDGGALPPERMREVAWIDDDDLLPGAMRVAKQRTVAQIMFLPPIPAIPNRKILAQATWGLVEAAYRSVSTKSPD